MGKEKNSFWLRTIPTVCSILLALAFLTPFFVRYWMNQCWEIVGQIGDSFGLLNAVVSASAFVALLYTLHLQRQENHEQQKQMDAQRKEAEKSHQLQLATAYLNAISEHAEQSQKDGDFMLDVLLFHLGDEVASFLKQNVPVGNDGRVFLEISRSLQGYRETSIDDDLHLKRALSLVNHFAGCSFSNVFAQEIVSAGTLLDARKRILTALKELSQNGHFSDSTEADLHQLEIEMGEHGRTCSF